MNRTPMSNPIALTLKNLISPKRKITLLAGAGVSIPPPSCLPSGGAFMSGLIRTIAPPELVDELLAFCNPERSDRNTGGDFLRFEGLLQLVQATVDPALEVLDLLDVAAHRQPNRNHYFLAALIRDGHTVLTTNFDSLIESAAADARVGIVCSPVIDSQDFDECARKMPVCPLFKLHGSLKRWTEQGLHEARESIRATLDAIGQAGVDMKFDPRKREVLRAALTGSPLVVLGYSGYDDFDIVPTLASMHSTQKLIWINHTSKPGDFRQVKFEQLEESMLAGYPGSFVKKDRDFIYTLGRSGVRPKDCLHLFDLDSAEAVEIIAEILGLAVIKPEASRDGSRPEDLQAYFAQWAKKRGLRDSDGHYIAGRIIGAMGRYSEGLAHMQLAHNAYVAAADPNVLIPASLFIADYCGRNGDYEVAYSVLDSTVPYLDDAVFASLIVYQLAFLLTKLPQYESRIRPLVERHFGTLESKGSGTKAQGHATDRIIQALEMEALGGTVPADAFDSGEEALQAIEQQAAQTGHMHDHLVITGKILFENKDYSRALAYFRKAFEWAEKLGDTEVMLDDLFSIEAVYYLRNERDLALATLDLCEALARQLGNKSMLSRIMGDRGLVQIELGDLRAAATSFDQSVAFASAARDPRLMALGYRNRGDAFSGLKDKDPAIESYEKAATLFRLAGMMEDGKLAAEKAQKLRDSLPL